MDLIVPYLFLLICILMCTWILTSSTIRRRRRRLPPGPAPFPIIGNILHLGRSPHLSLAKLSETYGPIMHLKLGTIDAIIVSSPQLAKMVLQKHDHVLSGRCPTAATDAYNHDKASILWLPSTSRRWKLLRKICKEHMFSLQRLNASWHLRREKLKKLHDHVRRCCERGRVLDIADASFTTSLNLISNIFFSIDFAEFGSDSSQELKGIVHGLLRTVGTPNVCDYFPFLKPFDPQGLRRRATSYAGEMFRIFNDIIEQRVLQPETRNDDLLQALLDISHNNESEHISRNDILHLLLDLFVGGTDSTATTVEWAMAELIRNPKKMDRARNELETVIGRRNEEIKETDITRLPYLQGVLKETFRLHPSGPLLVPHKAEVDTEVNGYTVPRNAHILVNIWAIGRDSSIWSSPDCFEPERFLESKIDIRGQDFGLLPFGSGRRMCPGLPLAYRVVHMVVATLIRGFDWKLEGGIKAEEIDTSEKFELSLHRAVTLRAIPVKL